MPRILLLDDDPELRAVVTQVLIPRGHQLVVCDDGDTLRAAAAQPAALLILGGRFSDAEGRALLTELRAAAAPALPALVVPQGRGEDELGALITVGQDGVGVLRRPFTPGALLLRVDAALHGPTQGRSPDSAGPNVPRERFAEGLPERLAELERLAADARVGDRAAIEAALHQSRQLHAAAGAWGNADLTVMIQRVEHILSVALDEPRGPQDIGWAELAVLLTRARADAGSNLVDGELLEETPLKVLIVAAEGEALEVAAQFGRRRSLQMIRATSLDEAVRRAATEEPDGALIEVELSGRRGGFSAAEALRALPGQAELPVAFFSADGGLANRLAATRAGALLFLPKPVTAMDLGYAARGLEDRARPEPLRALLLCVDAEKRAALQGLFMADGVHVRLLTEPLEILEGIARARPEVLLLDLTTPFLSALDLCRVVRADPAWQTLPIVLFDGPDDDDAEVEALAAGASDYLGRDRSPAALIARARGQAERARHSARLIARDPLTGLYPRHVFREYAQRLLSEARRRAETIALTLIRLDHFARFNAEHGYAMGDHVLAGVGRLMNGRFRRHDLRGYWGGDSFVIAFMNERPTAARLAVSRFLQDLSQRRLRTAQGREVSLTASAAVASFPSAGTSVDELVQAAEPLLDQALAAGGDQILILP